MRVAVISQLNAPAVSVVIPNHSRTTELAAAIESVLCQTCPSVETIVIFQPRPEIDSIRHEYEGRVRFIVADPPDDAVNPIAAKRNKGIDAASGEFVAFLDDDDVWHATKLERQLQALREAGSQVVACCTDVEEIGGPIADDYHWATGPSGQRLLAAKSIARANEFVTSTVMVPAALLRHHRFSMERATEAVEDYRLWLELAQFGYFLKLHARLARFRVSVSSYSSGLPTRKHARAAFVFASAACSRRLSASVRLGVVGGRMMGVLRHQYDYETDKQLRETAGLMGPLYRAIWGISRLLWKVPTITKFFALSHRVMMDFRVSRQ